MLFYNAFRNGKVFTVFLRNPTPAESDLPKWKPTTKYPWNYVRIGTTDLEKWFLLQNEDNFERKRVEFWKKLSPHERNASGKDLKDEL